MNALQVNTINMNYNANVGGKPPFGRKIKRVSDVNAMGYNPYDQPSPQPNVYPNLAPQDAIPAQYQQEYMNQSYNQGYGDTSRSQSFPANANPYMNPPVQMQNSQFGVFGQPVVQDMAMQYGQQLADTGKTMLKKEVEKYVPVTKLKYYFAVDTKYVVSKLMLLFFPFTQKDWSVKYEQDGGPVQPRFEINAPDLYIPTMAYVTYILVAGLVLGTQQRFTPEQIGMLASSALAWCLLELAVYSCTLYISNMATALRTLDLLAYGGYKFVGVTASALLGLVGGPLAYYCGLAYTGLALAFFLVRTLKAQVLPEGAAQASPYGGAGGPTPGSRRRLYFLLFVAAVQPLLAWWLSFHLLPPGSASTPS